MDIIAQIAQELTVNIKQVHNTVTLLDEGATVPFIARYRKERTGGLDDSQLRNLDQRLTYLRELDDRRQVILASVYEQGKLSAELKQAILGTLSKTTLEDLYLPFKPKRRTKAQIAREAGLEPLAELLLNLDNNADPQQLAAKFFNPEHAIETIDDALQGARQIIMEQLSENATLLERLREKVWQQGILNASVVEGKETEGAKFRDYFAYSEKLSKIPSHRALALFRGQREKFIQLDLVPASGENADAAYRLQVETQLNLQVIQTAQQIWLQETARSAWKIKLFTRIKLDLMRRLRENSELEAMRVFSTNLSACLLAPPAGTRATMGLDPGLRTGVKVAVVDQTGQPVETATIYPHAPKKQWDQSIAVLAKLCEQFNVELIAIGNGTASRETDQLAAELIKQHAQLKLTKIMVSEAGASVYSASQLASDELPNMDVSLRGAVSIARRLQDPLAELVKIEPKSIGIGQYQHDVNQVQLSKMLDHVVEDCVNAVGVDVNTASPALLKSVSGLTPALVTNIVQFRNENGAFKNRKTLKKVPRLGEKAFEQAAGFLRVMNGENPLDASAVHPEAYALVDQISTTTDKQIADLIGDETLLRQLDAQTFTTEAFGLPTVQDILAELEKPGRDPRQAFQTATFAEGVDKLSDLKQGMSLQGVVTNVTNFGAFVDIGVHQDGLVHISQLADRFIKDANDVVKAGDIVKVKVMEVDPDRKRIALTMRSDQNTPQTEKTKPKHKQESSTSKAQKTKKAKTSTSPKPKEPEGAFAQALFDAMKKTK
ncbi:MAG: Tex family protein [Methylococcales bacterium]